MRLEVVTLLVAAIMGPAAAAETPAAPAAFPAPLAMRVETELFADGREQPVARSLTLFENGVGWDFLELPGDGSGDAAAMKLAEIVLHDPARERVLVIDPVLRRKTEIPLVRLERLSVSLARWARSSDDRLVRWAGGPDFTAGFDEVGERLELSGPRVRYSVVPVAAESPAAAATYRQFADAAILLRSLLHPGGIPPFPRLAVNRRLEAEAAIPAEVTLEIESPLGVVTGGPSRLRSVHKSHPRLLVSDRQAIREAQASVATTREVDLAAFMDRTAGDETAATEGRVDRRAASDR